MVKRPSLERPTLPRLLDRPTVRRLIGLWCVGHGLAGVLAPRQTIRLGARLGLRELFENPGELEPTDTTVQLFRDASLATLVFGLLTLRRANRDSATAEAQAVIDEGAADEDAEADDEETDELVDAEDEAGETDESDDADDEHDDGEE